MAHAMRPTPRGVVWAGPYAPLQGVSRVMCFDGDIKDINVMSVTQKGVTVIGKPLYIAPQ